MFPSAGRKEESAKKRRRPASHGLRRLAACSPEHDAPPPGAEHPAAASRGEQPEATPASNGMGWSGHAASSRSHPFG